MLRIELPFPAPELFPNRKNGQHWGGVSGLKQAAMADSWALTAQAMGRGDHWWEMMYGNLSLSVEFCAPDKRKRDLDNMLAAIKPHLDGIAEALRVDDSRFCPITLSRGAVGKPGKVIVEIGHA